MAENVFGYATDDDPTGNDDSDHHTAGDDPPRDHASTDGSDVASARAPTA